jgi:drug/metabolite transporter (DMT)-like permease
VGIVAGVIFFDERVTSVIILGSLIIILSSGFILRREKKILA